MAPGHPPSAVRRLWLGLLLVGIALAQLPGTAIAGLAMPVDARDARGPLDLTEVGFSQRDVRMSLRIATSGVWTAKDIAATAERELCVTLIHGSPAIARGRICVTRRHRRPALSYAPLRADGTALARRHLAAAIRRPRLSVLEATFLPIAAGLPVGRYGWYATSAWSDNGACPRGCRDRLPDGGMVAANVGLLAVAPCFGAAARDPARPCENPALRLSVEPSLRRARDLQDPFCDAIEAVGVLSVCTFGAAAADAAGVFALVGDSHAAGLKVALEVATLARRWRGASMVRAGCPPTQATPALPTPQRTQGCVDFNDDVLTWLGEHRDIDTVFLSAHAKATVVPAAGESMTDAAQAGYLAQLRALLRRVPRVVVIRDVPYSRRRQLGCIASALDAGRPPGASCALPRADVLPADPLAAAAVALRSTRVTVVDLTTYFCDELQCFPVIGGALVQRDETHLTPTFSATLGPYLLRALG